MSNRDLMKKIGAEPGKIVPNPFHTAFMSEEQVKLVGSVSIKELAMQLLREEREEEKKKEEEKKLENTHDSIIPPPVIELNPSKVADNTEKQAKSLAKPKTITPKGAPKSKKVSEKYTNLSNHIPPEIKRRDEDEVPTISDKFNKEQLDVVQHEESKIEDTFDDNHIVTMKEILQSSEKLMEDLYKGKMFKDKSNKPPKPGKSVAKSGSATKGIMDDEWRSHWTQDGKLKSKKFGSDQSAAEKHAKEMHRLHTSK